MHWFDHFLTKLSKYLWIKTGDRHYHFVEPWVIDRPFCRMETLYRSHFVEKGVGSLQNGPPQPPPGNGKEDILITYLQSYGAWPSFACWLIFRSWWWIMDLGGAGLVCESGLIFQTHLNINQLLPTFTNYKVVDTQFLLWGLLEVTSWERPQMGELPRNFGHSCVTYGAYSNIHGWWMMMMCMMCTVLGCTTCKKGNGKAVTARLEPPQSCNDPEGSLK